MPLEAVTDTGPLIHLDELGQLGLLDDFVRVFAPALVLEEFARQRTQTKLAGQFTLVEIGDVSPIPADAAALAQALGLAAAEQQAIHAARAHHAALLLTDDAAARLTGETLGLRVHGSIGIILRAARRGQRPPAEVLALLERIPNESTLHIRRDLLRDIIEQFRREHGL